MNSRIFVGDLYHARLEPVRHQFRYPIYVYAFDLDELAHLDRSLGVFGYNRAAVVSLHDRDYGLEKAGGIKEKVLALAREHGHDSVERVVLVTAARWLQYVFNPVSFYYLYGADDTLRCAVAEVNNTFGERHCYVLPAAQATMPKALFVSPFNKVEGDYAFDLGDVREALDVRLDVLHDGRRTFHARLRGRPYPLTRLGLLWTLLRHPLTAVLTMPRIIGQAFALRRKGLRDLPTPPPSHPRTVRTHGRHPLQSLVLKFLDRMRDARLRVRLPDGTSQVVGQGGDVFDLHVRHPHFFTRLIMDGEIGVGESFVAGEWTAPDLAGTLSAMVANESRIVPGGWLGIFADLWTRLRHREPPPHPSQDVSFHYDRGNDFFASFLDESMTYSCAIFASLDESLETAQRRKIDAMIAKARIGSQHHLLEIGTGWGAFAVAAAQATGCRVTTVTLSREQHELAVDRVRAAGLSDRIDVRFMDYREVEGAFDRIVSIEMVEAVSDIDEFFGHCARLLRPGGVLALQAITLPDARYRACRERPNWIKKHIFPGSTLWSVESLQRAMWEFDVQSIERLGPHYALTLKHWRERLAPGERLFEYYFAHCEAAFRTGVVDDVQLVAVRR